MTDPSVDGWKGHAWRCGLSVLLTALIVLSNMRAPRELYRKAASSYFTRRH